jgi:glycosyltransferase involved in cell wall biosynthesis
VKSQNCLILFDHGYGLGAARNLGLSNASSEYVLNCGADNVLSEDVINNMLSTLTSEDNLLGVGCRTRVSNEGYLGKILEIQWSGRITPGRKEIVGTPNLFPAKLLKRYQFAETRTWSDDEELCTRMRLEENGDFKVIDDFCLEVGQAQLGKLRYRYLGYGKSDFEVWLANSQEWTISRRIQSLLHPFKSEFSSILKNIGYSKRITVLPLLIFATFHRYLGWVSTAMKYRKRRTGLG